MKTLKLFIFFIFLFTIKSFAQPGFGGEKREQIKALKIGFITDELQLTTEEATKFWPVFNSFESKQQELRRQKMKAFMDRADEEYLERLSDKDAVALLNQMEDNEEDLFQLRKKFISSLKAILPPIKIIKLKLAEEKFNKKLLKQYKEKRRE
jgi:Spy/CpxP family protein refolding chaperone